ncbi:helicase [Alteribacter lacisalsi]|uniref:Helicase n=2 Tax=Alteribacter lacisalsi TaxID=2045244 RepID=A0A2W0H7Q6_9BACI|nr:helicase [Alteribacter lacisalsi]
MYPNCPSITRTIELGGLSKHQLLQRLRERAIFINEYGEMLITDEKFTTSETKYCIETVEISVGSLGFPNGANTAEIFERAKVLGLYLCPLELGPYLRLEYIEQPEGNTGTSSQQNQAPRGAITVATETLYDDDDFPKGLYLRRINGDLWLRGYIADDLHIWNHNDHFVFCLTK